MKMFKKTVTSVLVVGQLIFACGAIASGTESANSASITTPELVLFTSSIALAGEHLSAQDAQAQLSQLFSDYERSAQKEGQMERMEQAMVTMNIYTSDQAHQLTLDAQAATNSSEHQVASNEVADFLSNYPAGAQFSACNMSVTLRAVGIPAALAGAIIWITNTKAARYNSAHIHENDPAVEQIGEIFLAAGVVGTLDSLLIDHYSSGC